MAFHVEKPEIPDPEMGDGPWGTIAQLIFVIGALIAGAWAWKHWK